MGACLSLQSLVMYMIFNNLYLFKTLTFVYRSSVVHVSVISVWDVASMVFLTISVENTRRPAKLQKNYLEQIAIFVGRMLPIAKIESAPNEVSSVDYC
jgi:hypothetical protein